MKRQTIMKKRCLYAVVAAALLASCTDKAEDIVAESQTGILAKVSGYEFGDQNGKTRVKLDQTENGLEFNWSGNEQIAIIGVETDEYSGQVFQAAQHNFSRFVTGDRLWAEFSQGAFRLVESAQYFCIYPWDSSLTTGEGQCERPMTFTGQVQNGNNSTDHIGKYDYMVSKVETTDEQGECKFYLDNYCCPLRFTLTFPDDAIGKSISELTLTRYQNADARFITSTLQKLENVINEGGTPSYQESDRKQSISQTLQLENCTLGEDKTLVAWEMFFPIDHISSGTPARYYITVRCEDGTEYIGQAAGKKMVAGSAYRIAATMTTSVTLASASWNIRNVGAQYPYDLGTLYSDYSSIPTDVQAKLPTVSQAEALCNATDYEILLGSGYSSTDNAKVMYGIYIRKVSDNNTETPIFLPATCNSNDASSFAGYYWLQGGSKVLSFNYTNGLTLEVLDATQGAQCGIRTIN